MTEAGPTQPRGVQFGTNFQLGKAPAFEPSIAVNPANPLNLDAVFFEFPRGIGAPVDCRSVFTFDGGQTWTRGGTAPLQKPEDSCGDPSIAADASGTFFFAYLDSMPAPGGLLSDDVVVARSIDGGLSFPTVALAADDVTQSIDKPYMTVDAQPGSPFRGNIYVSYSQFLPGDIRVVVSRDGGSTFAAPVTVAPPPGLPFFTLSGSLPIVAPDGTVYVIYAQYDFFAFGSLSIRFTKSADGGMTWTTPADVAAGLPSPGQFTLRNADSRFGTGAGFGIPVTSFPTAAVTPAGTLFVAWVDFPQGSCASFGLVAPVPCTNADVRMSVSTDGGRRWSSPVKVSDEKNTTDQFLPWIAAHPDGLLSLIWLDKRLDPSNTNFDLFYTNTFDGSRFLRNVRASSATSVIGTNGFIGDYNGLAATSDGVFPVWNDVRSGTPSVFTARGLLRP